ncbi:MAG: hypothetical protein LH650_08285 [Chloroflexi bacterium]|nr:hypothetical protein [Chloroflexota bacterium]
MTHLEGGQDTVLCARDGGWVAISHGFLMRIFRRTMGDQPDDIADLHSDGSGGRLERTDRDR